MDELSKEYVIDFFDRNLQLHGDRPEAVGWSAKGQQFHFQSLLDIGEISGKKVLDFGCGKGDLLRFLLDRGIQVDYTGYDINENLISIAEKKHTQGKFRVFDLDRESLDEVFDYIFLCGVFSLKISGIDEIIIQTLKSLFTHCRIGLAFNALSDYNPHKDFEMYYASPEELLSFAVKTLSPYVALRHDRMPYDFTLFIYKKPELGE